MELTAIVFSKNRPLQLHALLESTFACTSLPPASVSVLWKADPEFAPAMAEVARGFPGVAFHQETAFRAQTLRLIASSGDDVVFLTDDDVFKEDTDLSQARSVLRADPEVICFSLRLGIHLDHCFPIASPQNVPKGTQVGTIFTWSFRGADWDWSYPLSLDGHIFRRHEILDLAGRAGDWASPNSFEGNLSRLSAGLPHTKMASFTVSRLMNIPCNRVQSEVDNRFGGGSAHELLRVWLAGKKLDVRALHGVRNRSCHELHLLTFVDREGR